MPIWIKLVGLELKFWGARCLERLDTLIGRFLHLDTVTADKTLIRYAGILVEVTTEHQYPEFISFLDEGGTMVRVDMRYDWLLIHCIKCKGIGHARKDCWKQTRAEAPKSLTK